MNDELRGSKIGSYNLNQYDQNPYSNANADLFGLSSSQNHIGSLAKIPSNSGIPTIEGSAYSPTIGSTSVKLENHPKFNGTAAKTSLNNGRLIMGGANSL